MSKLRFIGIKLLYNDWSHPAFEMSFLFSIFPKTILQVFFVLSLCTCRRITSYTQVGGLVLVGLSGVLLMMSPSVCFTGLELALFACTVPSFCVCVWLWHSGCAAPVSHESVAIKPGFIRLMVIINKVINTVEAPESVYLWVVVFFAAIYTFSPVVFCTTHKRNTV